MGKGWTRRQVGILLAIAQESIKTIFHYSVSGGSTGEGEDSGITTEIESTTFSNDS